MGTSIYFFSKLSASRFSSLVIFSSLSSTTLLNSSLNIFSAFWGMLPSSFGTVQRALSCFLLAMNLLYSFRVVLSSSILNSVRLLYVVVASQSSYLGSHRLRNCVWIHPVRPMRYSSGFRHSLSLLCTVTSVDVNGAPQRGHFSVGSSSCSPQLPQ